MPRAGTWKFFTESDDGSRLWIDGELVVDNDGVHGNREVAGEVELKAGEQPIEVAMFERGGGASLTVRWEGPDLEKQVVPAEAYFRYSHVFAPRGAQALAVDEGKAFQGAEQFQMFGCARCHELEGQTAPPPRGKPLFSLDPRAPSGCLGDQPGATAPRYTLAAAERAAIRRVLFDHTSLEREADARHHVVRTMAELNCYACHEREGIGGPGDQRRLYFGNVTKVDMGEEGRIPPPLTGVGGKLRESWLRELLVGEGRSRPHMATAMPSYGEKLVGPLIEHLVALDAQPGDLDEPPFDLAAAETGHLLMGRDGLSCIECHSFGPLKSLSIPAGDLAGVYSRVRPGWVPALPQDSVQGAPGDPDAEVLRRRRSRDARDSGRRRGQADGRALGLSLDGRLGTDPQGTQGRVGHLRLDGRRRADPGGSLHA